MKSDITQLNKLIAEEFPLMLEETLRLWTKTQDFWYRLILLLSFRQIQFSETGRLKGKKGRRSFGGTGSGRRLRINASLDPLGRLSTGVGEQLADDLPDPVDTRQLEVVDEGDRPQ